MKTLNGAILLLSMVATAYADPAVRVPVAPVPVAPAPIPDPSGIVKLGAEELYLVESDVDLASIECHPKGLVKFEKTDPGTYYARFAGDGKWGKRIVKGPVVYLGTAAGTGRAELAFIPKGLKDSSEIVRAVVDVDSGKGPQPPPVDPKVDPTPVVVKSFRVIFARDGMATLTAKQTGVLYSQAIAKYLDATCTKDDGTPGWRRYTKLTDATNDYPPVRDLWASTKDKIPVLPCVVVEVNGKADVLSFPASEAEALATFRKYAEGK